MKNPYETDDIEELREIAFYWLQQHEKIRLENKVYMTLLVENKIECSLKNLIDEINNQIQEENGENN